MPADIRASGGVARTPRRIFEALEQPKDVASHQGLAAGDPDLADAEVEEDLGAHAVVAEVGREAELLVRFDGVGAVVLKLIRAQLVQQADATLERLVVAITEDSSQIASRPALRLGLGLEGLGLQGMTFSPDLGLPLVRATFSESRVSARC